ncbi:hypothetical protein N7532_007797 [Penicillium argentinense]|uniref:Uncharacterized protein n=1 Tax=Penicillium argentinense TaxID=1131581 RepID=A0A9W9K108_9EURO|nr:uncharacterized protein N7532_007797 [Penicillium argentinense]KAJ5089113.1 hypothetical protein N7532_007797 [Penicillium argentinense]
MLKTNTLAAALLIAGTLPAAMADKCYALGYWGMNSAGFGPGGTTYAGSEGLVLYNSADEESGRYEKCEHWCSGVCADFIEVPTDKLPAVFQWGATCRGSGFT